MLLVSLSAYKITLPSTFRAARPIVCINEVSDLKKPSLSEPQVLAILELKLQKLTALGINEIEVEIKKLSEFIINYKKIS